MEVDWQRRCEDTEREVLGKQEALMTNLAKARDEVCFCRPFYSLLDCHSVDKVLGLNIFF